MTELDYADLIAELASDMAEEGRSHARARLVFYRRFLQMTVRSASGLVGLVATPGELAAGLSRLWPPRGFDETLPLLARTRCSWFGESARKRLGRSRRRARAGRIDDLATMGALIRPPSGDVPGGGVRIVGDALEVRLADERSLLTTRAGVLRLDVETSIPETLVTALPGRLLSEVVEHQLLADGGHRIVRATSDGWYLSVFATAAVVAHRMPWPELLEARTGAVPHIP